MIRTKKSLGQHWLRSGAARAAIIKAAQLQPGEVVLEIGPGEGFLTEALLEASVKVTAVEKDDRLVTFLQNRFSTEIKSGQLTLINNDILRFEAKTLKYYKLIANIPYYLTGRILRQFLTAPNQPCLVVFLLQKEVAERLVARDGRESLFSISVKAFGAPRYLQTVLRDGFTPAPKVDSAVVAIDQISRKNFRPSDLEEKPPSEERFFAVLKRGFSSKRKLLKNNLGCSTELLAQCKIGLNARAEDLTLAQWLCLTTNSTAAPSKPSTGP